LNLSGRFIRRVFQWKNVYIPLRLSVGNLVMRKVKEFVTLLVFVLLSSTVSAQNTPNVVLVVMDNLGWGEIGAYGGGILRGAETPRLDQLAEEGMQFLNFNVETQCTPSRSALMTGRHPIRSGTTKVVWGAALRHDTVGSDDRRVACK
jgi:hypothetical protein